MHTDWKEKMHNWAPEPPEGGWERLSGALPQVAQPPYAQKLFDLSTPPPPAVWDAVASELTKEQPAPAVIQMYPRKRWLQVASIAAALLFAIYFLPPLFKTGQQPGTPASSTPALQQSIAPFTATGNQPEAPQTEELNFEKAPSATPESAVYFTQMPLPPKNREPLPIAETERTNSVLRSWLPETERLQQVGDQMERYIILAVADDAAIRLPKKLYAAFRCDEVPDAAGCLERLATLRRQMAAPEQLASADFLGLMEVVRNMGAGQ